VILASSCSCNGMLPETIRVAPLVVPYSSIAALAAAIMRG
jgi:hypothetical protein